MSTDLHGVLRFVHRVTGFLISLSPAQLTRIAEGRLSLAVQAEDEPSGRPSSVPVQRMDLPTPPARGPVTAGESITDVGYADIAAALRRQETVEDGSAYLKGLQIRGKKPLKKDLIAIAKELNLTLPGSITVPMATSKIIQHAIGNRRKYEGLKP